MKHTVTSATNPSDQARALCEQGNWLDVVGVTLDWQMEQPADAGAFFFQGVALAALGRFSEAETCYRRALQLDPQDFQIRNHLAELLFGALSRPVEGAECLAQALELDAGNQFGWARLAEMYGQLGQPEESLECAERALALDPEMAEAHLHRGRAAQILNKPEIVSASSQALARLPVEKFRRAG